MARKSKAELERQLIEKNLGLVISQAQHFSATRVTDIEDYIQEGLLVLLQAIRNYDSSKGAKLGTYATKSIWRAIRRHQQKFSNQSFEITNEPANKKVVFEKLWELLPANLTEDERKVLKMRMEGCTLQEIGNKINYSKEWVNHILNSAYDKIRATNDGS